jgi:lipoprotein NlpD
VVYRDSQLKGFGQTIIIDHGDGYQTVYSYNSAILVNVGDDVRQRDAIAKVGSSGRAKEPTLHFEIRRNGEPHNPEFYLSKR